MTSLLNGSSSSGTPLLSQPRSVSYILFNESWDRVAGNRITQSMAPISGTRLENAMGRYLEYLKGSLRSFTSSHERDIRVRVWLVEISSNGLGAERVREEVKKVVFNRRVEVTTLGYPIVKPFIDDAIKFPDTVYRSPNRLHEFLNFFILKHAKERFVSIVDTDVVFIERDAVDSIFARLMASGKCAAGFVEKPRLRNAGEEQVMSRERLHSIAVFFDVPVLRKHVPLDPFLRLAPLEQRLPLVRDEEARRYYSTHRFLDTFSILTEMLRHNDPVDRLLELNSVLAHFDEGDMLTVVCDKLIHAKYLEPNAGKWLRSSLARSGLGHKDNEAVARLLQRCSPSVPGEQT